MHEAVAQVDAGAAITQMKGRVAFGPVRTQVFGALISHEEGADDGGTAQAHVSLELISDGGGGGSWRNGADVHGHAGGKSGTGSKRVSCGRSRVRGNARMRTVRLWVFGIRR